MKFHGRNGFPKKSSTVKFDRRMTAEPSIPIWVLTAPAAIPEDKFV
jgi:hypothetical protein